MKSAKCILTCSFSCLFLHTHLKYTPTCNDNVHCVLFYNLLIFMYLYITIFFMPFSTIKITNQVMRWAWSFTCFSFTFQELCLCNTYLGRHHPHKCLNEHFLLKSCVGKDVRAAGSLFLESVLGCPEETWDSHSLNGYSLCSSEYCCEKFTSIFTMNAHFLQWWKWCKTLILKFYSRTSNASCPALVQGPACVGSPLFGKQVNQKLLVKLTPILIMGW